MCTKASDALIDEEAVIVSNEALTDTLYLMVLAAPELAQRIQPGQFIHMRLPGTDSHLLRRPFSVYDITPDGLGLEVLYQVVGAGTEILTHVELGASTQIIGPVGHGWTADERCKRALFVVGGVGAAPLYMFAKELVARGVHVDVVLGAQTLDALVCERKYACTVNGTLTCTTDDGSYGVAGFATGPAKEALAANEYDMVYCCGPEPLMKAVAALAAEAQVPCQVSMEKRMACGIGACLSCVVETVDGLKRSCVDGPIFDAEKVVFG